ncbi:MAG TPA: DUF3012 domain-containing protein [Halioglobus sp.]
MRQIVVIGCVLLLGACSVEPGSEKWCTQKKDQPKSEWTSSDAVTFAGHCLLDSTTVGSADWCKDLSDKPKGEWTANDTASYAKHCVM